MTTHLEGTRGPPQQTRFLPTTPHFSLSITISSLSHQFLQQSHTKQRDSGAALLTILKGPGPFPFFLLQQNSKTSYSSNSCPSALARASSTMHLPSAPPTHDAKGSKASPLLTACLNYTQLILPSLYPSLGFWDASVSRMFFFANGYCFFFLSLSFVVSISYPDPEPWVLKKSALKPPFFLWVLLRFGKGSDVFSYGSCVGRLVPRVPMWVDF